MENQVEIWKDVVGYKGIYQVSNLGRVKSLEVKRFTKANNSFSTYKEKILNQSYTKDGYLKITFTVNKVKKTFLVHRLVATAFIENPNNKPEVNHINGIKDDNSYKNLEWNTPVENVKHAYKNGLKTPKQGVENGCSKLSEKEVLEIRKIGKTMFKKDIAILYNVGASTISRVQNKTHWKHI
jgi:hypothetical protein